MESARKVQDMGSNRLRNPKRSSNKRDRADEQEVQPFKRRARFLYHDTSKKVTKDQSRSNKCDRADEKELQPFKRRAQFLNCDISKNVSKDQSAGNNHDRADEKIIQPFKKRASFLCYNLSKEVMNDQSKNKKHDREEIQPFKKRARFLCYDHTKEGVNQSESNKLHRADREEIQPFKKRARFLCYDLSKEAVNQSESNKRHRADGEEIQPFKKRDRFLRYNILKEATNDKSKSSDADHEGDPIISAASSVKDTAEESKTKIILIDQWENSDDQIISSRFDVIDAIVESKTEKTPIDQSEKCGVANNDDHNISSTSDVAGAADESKMKSIPTDHSKNSGASNNKDERNSSTSGAPDAAEESKSDISLNDWLENFGAANSDAQTETSKENKMEIVSDDQLEDSLAGGDDDQKISSASGTIDAGEEISKTDIILIAQSENFGASNNDSGGIFSTSCIINIRKESRMEIIPTEETPSSTTCDKDGFAALMSPLAISETGCELSLLMSAVEEGDEVKSTGEENPVEHDVSTTIHDGDQSRSSEPAPAAADEKQAHDTKEVIEHDSGGSPSGGCSPADTVGVIRNDRNSEGNFMEEVDQEPATNDGEDGSGKYQSEQEASKEDVGDDNDTSMEDTNGNNNSLSVADTVTELEASASLSIEDAIIESKSTCIRSEDDSEEQEQHEAMKDGGDKNNINMTADEQNDEGKDPAEYVRGPIDACNKDDHDDQAAFEVPEAGNMYNNAVALEAAGTHSDLPQDVNDMQLQEEPQIIIYTRRRSHVSDGAAAANGSLSTQQPRFGIRLFGINIYREQLQPAATRIRDGGSNNHVPHGHGGRLGGDQVQPAAVGVTNGGSRSNRAPHMHYGGPRGSSNTEGVQQGQVQRRSTRTIMKPRRFKDYI